MCSDLHGTDRQETERRVSETLKLVGLSNVKKRIGSFSRGMKQRIGIAQAMIHDPNVILMDEPVSALDPEGRYDVIEILKELKGRKTIFLSSHIIPDIEKVCDHVAIINNGVLLESGTVADLKKKYDSMTIDFSVPPFVSDDKLTRFEEAIRLQTWCKESKRKTPYSFSIRVISRSEAQTALPAIMASIKIPVESFDSLTTTLEEVFLEVIRK